MVYRIEQRISPTKNLNLLYPTLHTDTIMNGSPKALVLRLLSSGHQILFSSEKGCCRYLNLIPVSCILNPRIHRLRACPIRCTLPCSALLPKGNFPCEPENRIIWTCSHGSETLRLAPPADPATEAAAQRGSTKWALMAGSQSCDPEWPPPPGPTATPFLNSGCKRARSQPTSARQPAHI